MWRAGDAPPKLLSPARIASTQTAPEVIVIRTIRKTLVAATGLLALVSGCASQTGTATPTDDPTQHLTKAQIDEVFLSEWHKAVPDDQHFDGQLIAEAAAICGAFDAGMSFAKVNVILQDAMDIGLDDASTMIAYSTTAYCPKHVSKYASK